MLFWPTFPANSQQLVFGNFNGLPPSSHRLASQSISVIFNQQELSVATPAEPRGEKKHFFVQILGGEKLLKFVEKCQ